MKIRKAAGNTFKFKKQIKVFTAIMRDSRTPLLSKILLGAAVVYIVSPIDIIPDFIPLLGFLDDAIIVPFLFYIALHSIPKNLVEEYRRKINNS